MKKYIITTVIFIVFAVGAYFLFYEKVRAPVGKEEKTYHSERLGIEFLYPALYFLEEKETGDAHRERVSIILTEDTEENRLVREGKSPGRDGPTAIAIDFFQNNLDKSEAVSWIRSSNDSNFKLSDGELGPIEIGKEDALAYSWSGLYEADAAVVSRENWIYMFTATYLDREDRIRGDFKNLLKTVKFED